MSGGYKPDYWDGVRTGENDGEPDAAPTPPAALAASPAPADAGEPVPPTTVVTCPGCGSAGCKSATAYHCSICKGDYFQFFGTADWRGSPFTAPAVLDIDTVTASIHQACVDLAHKYPDDQAGFIRMARDAAIDAVLAAQERAKGTPQPDAGDTVRALADLIKALDYYATFPEPIRAPLEAVRKALSPAQADKEAT